VTDAQASYAETANDPQGDHSVFVLTLSVFERLSAFDGPCQRSTWPCRRSIRTRRT